MRRLSPATRAALVAALLWSAIGIVLLPAYGPTWDCAIGELPFGESLLHAMTSRDGSLADAPLHPTHAAFRQPHPDFEMEMQWWNCWPVAAVLSAVSCRVFWTALGWLPAVAAHHLPIVLFVAVLVFVVVRFVGERLGWLHGVAAAALLLASPRFFADSFGNLKDVPEACLHTFVLLTAAAAATSGRRILWILAGALGGIAWAQKTNGLFLPIESALVIALWRIARIPRPASATSGFELPDRAIRTRTPTWRGALVALVSFVAVYAALSPQLWFDPVERVREQYGHVLRTGVVGGRMLPASDARPLLVGFDGLLQFVCTTPVPVLLLAPLGLVTSVFARRDRVLFFVAAAFPIGRTLVPGAANFDGVRHFLEFDPPLCMLAAGGLAAISRALSRFARSSRLARAIALVRVRRALPFALALAALAPGALATARTHPNGCAYYNFLIGGLSGAQRRGLPEATDYWGNSYWQALSWLDAHAEPDATVATLVAGHIVRTCAPVRLRADLKLADFHASDAPATLYVMYITRPSHYDRFARRIDLEHPPVHVIEVDRAPILKIHRFVVPDSAAVWRSFRDARLETLLQRAITAWALASPDRARDLRFLLRDRALLGDEETAGRLRALLPPDLRDSADEFLRSLRPAR